MSTQVWRVLIMGLVALLALLMAIWLADEPAEPDPTRGARQLDPLSKPGDRLSTPPGRATQALSPGQPTAGTGKTEPHAQQAEAAGLSPADLVQLRTELLAHPRGEAELRRVLAFLSYQREWQRFDDQLRAGATPASLRTLAGKLDAGLAERWQQGEVNGAQALQMKARLLEVLMEDDSHRRRVLAEWQAQMGIGSSAQTSTRQAALNPAISEPGATR